MALLSDISELPARGRWMGIDHGTRRIGLAMTDAERRLAQPLETVRNRMSKVNFSRIATLASSNHVSALIIGYPLSMDGSEGPRCQSVRAFVRNLEAIIDLPMLLWDERLSSDEAKELLREAQSRTEQIDAAAAAVILQSAVNQLSSS